MFQGDYKMRFAFVLLLVAIIAVKQGTAQVRAAGPRYLTLAANFK
jgi:hypothetical protein